MSDRQPPMDDQQSAALNRFWNELLNPSGAPVAGGEGLDPALIETIRRLQALGAAPPPASSRERVRQAVRANVQSRVTSDKETPVTQTGYFELTRPVAGTNGKVDHPSTTWPRLRFPAERRKWLVAQFAMALLLVVTFVAIYLALFQGNQPAHQPATALPATPLPAPTPDTTAGAWSMYLGDAARSNIADAGPVRQPGELWRVQAGGPCDSSVTVVGSVVYVGCGDGVLYALDAATGAERWRFTIAGTWSKVAAVVGLVYAVDGRGTLYAIDTLTGQERWQSALPVATHPAVDGGLLVAGTTDGFLVGLDAAIGQERWRFQVTSAGSVHNPALAEGVVYASSDSGGLVAVDAATGVLHWRADFGTDSGGTARPVDGVVYLGGERLRAFDAGTGDVLWTIDTMMPGGLTVSSDLGFAAGVGAVYAVDVAAGSVRWQVPLDGQVGVVIVADELVHAFSSAERVLYALELATGQERWKYDLGEDVGGIAMADGVMYIGTGFGSIIALGETDGTPMPDGVGTMASPEAVATPTSSPSADAIP